MPEENHIETGRDISCCVLCARSLSSVGATSETLTENQAAFLDPFHLKLGQDDACCSTCRLGVDLFRTFVDRCRQARHGIAPTDDDDIDRNARLQCALDLVATTIPDICKMECPTVHTRISAGVPPVVKPPASRLRKILPKGCSRMQLVDSGVNEQQQNIAIPVTLRTPCANCGEVIVATKVQVCQRQGSS